MQNKFPERLTELLTDNKISARTLAKQIGVAASTVSAWARGAKQPTADNILAVAYFFDVSADYLLGKIE